MKNNKNTINKITVGCSSIHPYFVTGFTDAEGCFYVGVVKSKRVKIGWEVQPEFKIELHKKDIRLLLCIQEFFNGVGKISQKGDKVIFRVRSIKELKVVISHFEKYPLITQKWADYELFKSVVGLVESQEHVTEEGFRSVWSIKASVNRGLSKNLQGNFPDIHLVPRPLVVDQVIKDPNWVAGFTSASPALLSCPILWFFSVAL